jgi:hypothetical protein
MIHFDGLWPQYKCAIALICSATFLALSFLKAYECIPQPAVFCGSRVLALSLGLFEPTIGFQLGSSLQASFDGAFEAAFEDVKSRWYAAMSLLATILLAIGVAFGCVLRRTVRERHTVHRAAPPSPAERADVELIDTDSPSRYRSRGGLLVQRW